VNFTYADVLKTADNFLLFKMRRRKSRASTRWWLPLCQALLEPHGHGRALPHLDGQQEDAEPFLRQERQAGLALSTMGYQFLAGILTHARALTAICAPTVNSYKRLVVGRSLSGATWAPAYIAYGDNNRTALRRIPGGRIEMRRRTARQIPISRARRSSPRGSTAIERRLDPGEPLNENLYEMPAKELKRRKIGLLPQHLAEALDALEADERGEGGHRRGPGEGIPHGEAHGVDRILAARDDWKRRATSKCSSHKDPRETAMCGIVGLLVKKSRSCASTSVNGWSRCSSA